MKRIFLLSALALSTAGAFASSNPADSWKTAPMFDCQATFNRVLINAEGEAVYTITHTAVGANCFEAMAVAKAYVERDTPFWRKFWKNMG